MMAEGPVEVIEPEYFVFADNSDYMRGFVSAANAIAKDRKGSRRISKPRKERATKWKK